MTNSAIAGCCVVMMSMACDKAAPVIDSQGRTTIEPDDRIAAVEVVEIAELSFRGLPRAPMAYANVFLLPGAGWGVSSGAFRGTIQLFSASGEPAGTLGRSGEGPGEIRGKVFALTLQNDFYVVQPDNARIDRYNADLVFQESRPFTRGVYSVSPAAGDSTILVGGYFGGNPVGIVGMDESRDRHGGIELESNPQDFYTTRQRATMSPEGEVWTVTIRGGTVTVLDDSLSLALRLFLPLDVYHTGTGTTAVHGIMADSSGMIWILANIDDENRTPDLRVYRDGYARVIDTLIVGIDSDERRIAAIGRVDPACNAVQGNLMSCVHEGEELVKIMKISVGGPAPN